MTAEIAGAETAETGWVEAMLDRLSHRIEERGRRQAAASKNRLYAPDLSILDEVRAWLDNLPASADGKPLECLLARYNGPGRNRVAMGKAAARSRNWRLAGRRPRRLRRRRIQN